MEKSSTYNLNELYNLAEDEEISIYDYHFNSDRKAIAVAQDETQFIGIDFKKISTEAEERSILAEEISHHQVGIIPSNIFSNSRVNKLIRSQNEARCKKKYILKLIDKDEFIKDLASGYFDLSFGYNIHDLAEKHCVTEDDIKLAIDIYGGDLDGKKT